MKYWVYLNGEVLGSYEPSELVRIPAFSKTSLVCPVEGNAGQRNWRHAGMFPEIVQTLESISALGNTGPKEMFSFPTAVDYVKAFPPTDKTAPNPEEILQGATQRIFNHVTELMKELENRREERALNQSLERHLAEVKQELLAARERIKALEEQAALLPGFEDREQKLEEFLERARADVKFRDHRIKELNHEMEELRRQLEEARDISAQSPHLLEENRKLKQLEESLNAQLAEKELTLAKSLGLLRRIEGELGGIVPGNPASTAALPQPKPKLHSPEPHKNLLPPVEATNDEGRIEHPVPMPPEEGVVYMAPAWKVALNMLSDILKRPFRSDR